VPEFLFGGSSRNGGRPSAGLMPDLPPPCRGRAGGECATADWTEERASRWAGDKPKTLPPISVNSELNLAVPHQGDGGDAARFMALADKRERRRRGLPTCFTPTGSLAASRCSRTDVAVPCGISSSVVSEGRHNDPHHRASSFCSRYDLPTSGYWQAVRRSAKE
jgi:hypothetical protein